MKGDKQCILVENGLHNIPVCMLYSQFWYDLFLTSIVQHFLWDFCFADPYKAVSYNTLHSDDLSKWGKHLWVLLLKVLEDAGALGKVTQWCVLLIPLLLFLC